jgi:hypothetical protein
MDDVYERRHEDVDAWLQHYPPDPGQVGIAAFLDDRPLALDAVGCPGLWWRVHARFLGGYVMDALARRGGRKPRASDAVMPGPEAAERFLADVSTARRIDSDTVGCGRYRVLSGSAIGAELVDDRHGASRLAHLSAYPSPVDRRS